MSNIEKKNGWAGVLNGKPKIGQSSELCRTTKASDITAFTEMTGDKNPVHYDEELAKGFVGSHRLYFDSSRQFFSDSHCF